MTNGGGKMFKDKGSSNLRSASRIIDKKARNEKNSRIRSNLSFVHTTTQTYAFAPANPNVPTIAPATSGNYNWTSAEGEMLASRDHLSGFIFMCNGKTKADCYKYRVFGLPAAKMEVVEKIKLHTKLFLFDFDLKLLYGVYTAASKGELGMEPTAFGGRFSAQVRFEIFKDCLPLPESAFKHVIKDNYNGGSKFRQELSAEQVTNLISTFRPMAVSPSGSAVSLMPNAVRPAKFVPPGIEVQTRPVAEFSSSYAQYLGRSQLTHHELALNSQHVQQAGPLCARVPHASIADMDCLQPTTQSMHLLPKIPQTVADPYYPAEGRHVYFPEYHFSHQQTPFCRYTAVPNDGERGIVMLSSSTNDHTGVESFNAPGQVHARMPSQLSATSHGHMRLRSSSLTAAYWAGVAYEGPKQECSSHQLIPSVSTGLGHKNVPVPSVGAGLTRPAMPEKTDTETFLQLGSADNNHDFSLAVTSAPIQAHATVPLQFRAPSHGAGTNKESASQLGAAYGYHHNLAVSATNASLQAHVQVSSQVPGPSYGLAKLTSSSEVAAYWTAMAAQDPNQVYSGSHQMLSSVEGTAYCYDHNLAASATNATLKAQTQAPLYGAAYLPSSSEAAASWTQVASEDPNLVYSGPHEMPPEYG
ncbi:unnamed protein product [Ilex paraguariensis]|uniref:DCD domain-containing protein n=1 Tax=Ilex paraguariensis TaxID=185542 RepID=A0ABC8TDF5_9AQUA